MTPMGGNYFKLSHYPAAKRIDKGLILKAVGESVSWSKGCALQMALPCSDLL
jgi:hypothetical protein